jgi:hypothetical protein
MRNHIIKQVFSILNKELKPFMANTILMAALAGTCPLIANEPLSNRKAKVTVSGEVLQVRIMPSPSAYYKVFDVSVRVHFHNRGPETILLFADDLYPWPGGICLASSKENLQAKKYMYSKGLWLSCDPEGWAGTWASLDQYLPPNNLIRTINPGSEWSCERKLVVCIEGGEEYDVNKRIIDPLWLEIEFEIWPSNLREKLSCPTYDEELKDRWTKQGVLILDNLTSEPISLSLL